MDTQDFDLDEEIDFEDDFEDLNDLNESPAKPTPEKPQAPKRHGSIEQLPPVKTENELAKEGAAQNNNAYDAKDGPFKKTGEIELDEEIVEEGQLTPEKKSETPEKKSDEEPAFTPTKKIIELEAELEEENAETASEKPRLSARVKQARPKPKRRSQSALDNSDAVKKLKAQNKSLQKQLMQLSRALDQHLNSRGVKMKRKSHINTSSEVDQSEINNLHRQLKMYRKANADLKKKLYTSASSEKHTQLRNRLKDKQRKIEELKRENKALMNVQREQSKRLELLDNGNSEFFQQNDTDLRVQKAETRKYRDQNKKMRSQLDKVNQRLLRISKKYESAQKTLKDRGLSHDIVAQVKELQKSEAEKDKTIEHLEQKIQIQQKSVQSIKRRLRMEMKSNRAGDVEEGSSRPTGRSSQQSQRAAMRRRPSYVKPKKIAAKAKPVRKRREPKKPKRARSTQPPPSKSPAPADPTKKLPKKSQTPADPTEASPSKIEEEFPLPTDGDLVKEVNGDTLEESASPTKTPAKKEVDPDLADLDLDLDMEEDFEADFENLPDMSPPKVDSPALDASAPAVTTGGDDGDIYKPF